jgi:hypothetical protein
VAVNKEDKITIRQFKSGESSWWVNSAHYHLNEVGDVIFCAGGVESKEDIEALKSYIKRNKKQFVKSTPNIFAQDLVEYSIISFGIHKGKKLDTIDQGYLKWLYENTTDIKIKAELKILLGK